MQHSSVVKLLSSLPDLSYSFVQQKNKIQTSVTLCLDKFNILKIQLWFPVEC